MRKIKILKIIFFVLFVFPLIVNGNDSEQFSYQKGFHYFKKKDYLSAREIFLKQESINPNDIDLLYNLGVVNYKLGFYPSSKTYFLRLKNSEKYAAMAYYNLSLIAFRLGNEAEAKQWLKKSLNSNPSKSVLKLTTRLMDKANMSGQQFTTQEIASKSFPLRKKMKTFLKSSLGYNDNVTQFLTFSDKKISDNFVDLQIDSIFRVFKKLNLQLSAFFHTYNNTTSYNTSNLTALTEYEKLVNKYIQLENIFLISSQSINGKSFQQLYEANLKAKFKSRSYFGLALNYKVQKIVVTDDTYNHLTGLMQQIQAAISYYANSFQLNLTYEYELNNRKDFYSNNTLNSSFSPRIHSLDLRLKYSRNKLSSEVFITNGLSQYPDKNILYPNSNFPRQVLQKGLRSQYGIKLSYQIDKSLYAIASYDFERNYSNIRDFRYEKNIYQTGISWQY